MIVCAQPCSRAMRGLLLRAHGADEVGAQRLRPLAGDEAHAAGRRVEEDRLAGLDRVGAPQQVLDREALQHHAGGLLEGDRVGQLHQPLGGMDLHLGVGAQGAGGPGHAVADLQVGDAGADRLDHARAFPADRRGQRQRVQAAAMVGVDVVEADGLEADAGLVGAGIADRDLVPLQDFGAAGLVESDRVGHCLLLSFVRLVRLVAYRLNATPRDARGVDGFRGAPLRYPGSSRAPRRRPSPIRRRSPSCLPRASPWRSRSGRPAP